MTCAACRLVSKWQTQVKGISARHCWATCSTSSALSITCSGERAGSNVGHCKRQLASSSVCSGVCKANSVACHCHASASTCKGKNGVPHLGTTSSALWYSADSALPAPCPLHCELPGRPFAISMMCRGTQSRNHQHGDMRTHGAVARCDPPAGNLCVACGAAPAHLAAAAAARPPAAAGQLPCAPPGACQCAPVGQPSDAVPGVRPNGFGCSGG